MASDGNHDVLSGETLPKEPAVGGACILQRCWIAVLGCKAVIQDRHIHPGIPCDPPGKISVTVWTAKHIATALA